MSQKGAFHRLAITGGSALLGGMVGVLLTAFGNGISSSVTGASVTILLACIIGGWSGRLAGAVVGAICGGFLVAFGSVIGGSVLGVGLTIAGCALLGGWLGWAHEYTDYEHALLGGEYCLASEERPTDITKRSGP